MNKNNNIASHKEAKALVTYAWNLIDSKPKHLIDKDILTFTALDWENSLIIHIKNEFNSLKTKGYELPLCTGETIKNLLKGDVGKKNLAILVIGLFILFVEKQITENDNSRLMRDTEETVKHKIFYLHKALGFINGKEDVLGYLIQKPTTLSNYNSYYWVKSILLIGIILLILAFFYTFSQKSRRIDYSTIKFEISPSVVTDEKPDIEIRYDISALPHDSAFIKLGDDTPVRKLTSDIGTIKHTFTRAWGREITLKVDTVEKVYYKPIYSKKNLVFVGGYFFEEQTSIKNGIFHIPQSYIPIAYLDRGVYFCGFQKIQDFGVDADNMIFETQVKNSPDEGGLPAYDIAIDLNGMLEDNSKGILSFNVLHANATKYLRLQVGKTKEGLDWDNNGNEIFHKPQQSMNFLGLNTNKWITVKAITQNNILKIYVDEQLKHEVAYKGKIGKLQFIQIGFVGTGSINWIKIFDLNKNIHFSEDF